MRILRYTDAAYADEIRQLNRRAEASDHVQEVVAGVIKNVRERGDAAVLELTKKFDGADLSAGGATAADWRRAALDKVLVMFYARRLAMTPKGRALARRS